MRALRLTSDAVSQLANSANGFAYNGRCTLARQSSGERGRRPAARSVELAYGR